MGPSHHPTPGRFFLPLTVTTAKGSYPGITFRLANQLNNEFQGSFAYKYLGPKYVGPEPFIQKVQQHAETVSIPEQGQQPIFIPPVGGDSSTGTDQRGVLPPVNLTTGEKVPPVAPGSMDGEASQDEAVFPPGSIFAPGQVWGSDNRGNDFPESPEVAGGLEIPNATYDDVKTDGGEDVAIDWGDVIGGALQDVAGGLIGQTLSGPVPASTTFPQTPPPAEVVVDTRTGQVKKCPRRRRKRLLTPTDLSDLAALQALVGKGSSALNMAVAKAVRR